MNRHYSKAVWTSMKRYTNLEKVAVVQCTWSDTKNPGSKSLKICIQTNFYYIGDEFV